MTTFTVIAYRPDGVDTCRGCVMDRSSSDFEMRCFQDIEEAAAWQAHKLMNSPHGREYCSWEFTHLIDGLDSDSWWQVHGDSDLEEPPFYELQKLAERKWKELVDQKAEQERLAQEATARQAELDRARQAQEKEARERAEFKRLQDKYGTAA